LAVLHHNMMPMSWGTKWWHCGPRASTRL